MPGVQGLLAEAGITREGSEISEEMQTEPEMVYRVRRKREIAGFILASPVTISH